MMSPTQFAVRNAALNKQLESARAAGDIRAMQRLISEKTGLLVAMYGRAEPPAARC